MKHVPCNPITRGDDSSFISGLGDERSPLIGFGGLGFVINVSALLVGLLGWCENCTGNLGEWND